VAHAVQRSQGALALNTPNEEHPMGDKSPKDKTKKSKRKTAQTKKDADAAKVKDEAGSGNKKP
jgi:hypothetical protein